MRSRRASARIAAAADSLASLPQLPVDGREQRLQFGDRLGRVEPALDFTPEPLGRHFVLRQLRHDLPAGQQVWLREPRRLQQTEAAQSKGGQRAQPVGDHHRPLAEQRFERRRAGGDQHDIRCSQHRAGAAVDQLHVDARRPARERLLEQRARARIRERRRRNAGPVAGPRARRSRPRNRRPGARPRRPGCPAARATTGASAGKPSSRRAAARIGRERQLVGERMTDEHRAQPDFVVDRASRTATGTARGRGTAPCRARARAARPTPADSRIARCGSRPRAVRGARLRLNSGASMPTNTSGCAARMRSRTERRRRSSRGRWCSTSNSPITASSRDSAQVSQPSACIAGPATPTKRVAGCRGADRADQRGAEVVAGGFAGHHADRQRSVGGHQRMMLRSLLDRKFTNGTSSGWLAASSFSCASASASLRPERYSSR